MTKEIYLGFDPGGKKHKNKDKSVLRGFGWAVCSSTGHNLNVLETGLANNAKEAIEAVTETLKTSEGRVVGAGIDAPLFWTESGDRKVDQPTNARTLLDSVKAIENNTSTLKIQGFVTLEITRASQVDRVILLSIALA